MKGLLSTAASRAWLGVALVGLVIVVLVFALSLMPRLGAGQDVIDAARPAFTDERIAGTRSASNLLSQYVDLADPLVSARGGANREVRSLVRLMRRRLDLSSEQVRRILRREAPHTEALTRALPLTAVSDEIPRLIAYLATTLALTEEGLAATLEQDFPAISQALTALPNMTSAWSEVPGIEGLTRLSRGKPVRTVPGLRKYLRDDVVGRMVEHREDFQRLAAWGGVGYIPYLLLAIGFGLLAYGLLQARRASQSPPGRLAWRVVVALGAVVVALVVVAQYLPRFAAGEAAISGLEPVFETERVRGLANGIDTVHDAIAFGGPIMTLRGGASAEAPRLYRFVAERTGRSSADVRRSLEARAPRTIALFDALPLSAVAGEVTPLVAYLARALRMPGDRVVALLRRRTPGLAQSLLAAPAVAIGWNAIPGTGGMMRFDRITPVHSMGEFDGYLRQDLVPVIVAEREHVGTLASTWPPLGALALVLLAVGLVVVGYGGLMTRLVARRH